MPEGKPDDPPSAEQTPAPKPDLEIWRERATHAQNQVSQLTARITELERELTEHKSKLTRNEQDSVLASSGALDNEVIRALIESLLKSKPATDFKTALSDLKKSKPFLFRAAGTLMPAAPVVPQRTSGFTGQPAASSTPHHSHPARRSPLDSRLPALQAQLKTHEFSALNFTTTAPRRRVS